MIISLTLNGEIYSVEPEQIYQGANNVNEIFIFAPLSANTSFEMEFTLPNGHKTRPYILERIAPVSSQLNTWKLVVDAPLTQYYGVVKYQFKGTINGTTTATGQGSFTITQGVDWVLPETPDTNTYELIVNKIAKIEGELINAKADVESALQNSQDALQKGEQAISSVQGAIDLSNRAITLAEGVDAKATTALTNSQVANTNAEEALEVAEEAKALASEKANSKVFDKYSDMVAWLRNAENKGKLSVGSTLYIKDENVPDYWVTAVYEEADTLGFYYGFEELESKLPDISNMVTTDTEQNITGAKNFTSIKKNGYDLQGKLTGIDFVSTDNMTTYADGKATIHGEFTTTTETDKTANVISGSIEFGIKGSDTIVVEEDEEGNAIEIHLDKAIEDKLDEIESGLADKVGTSAINGLQQQIDQTNIDINEVRNIANNNTQSLEAKADAIDLANLDAKALKTPLSAPSTVKLVAINTNNAQTLVDMPEGIDVTNLVTLNTEQTITAKKTFSEDVELDKDLLDKNGNLLIEQTTSGATLGNINSNLVVASAIRPAVFYKEGTTQITSYIASLSDLDKLYPVGSIYLTTSETSPASFIGGSWEKLPEGYALWTATTDAGNTINAGLPNIKGSFQLANIAQTNTSASGVFDNQKGSDADYTGGSSTTSRARISMDFDANRYNSIYNDETTTVQPPAYKVYAWKRKA